MIRRQQFSENKLFNIENVELKPYLSFAILHNEKLAI